MNVKEVFSDWIGSAVWLRGLLLFLVAAGLSALTQVFLFDSIPHVTDAAAHLFQAKLIARGRISATVPPCYDSFFQFYLLMTSDGRWFSRYPPGWPLLLAGAMRLQLLPALGPVLAGLGTLFSFELFRRWLSPKLALLAGLLVATSPMLVLLGGSYMSHTPSMALFALALWMLLHGVDRPQYWARVSWVLTAGFATGWAVLVRPQDAILMGPVGLAAWFLAPSSRRSNLTRVAPWFFLGTIGPLGFLAWWNIQQYGRPLAMGYYTWKGVGVRNLVPLLDSGYGFTETFTFRRALSEEFYTLWRFNCAAFGWPASFALALLTVARMKFRSPETIAWLALIWNAIFFLGYDYYGMEYEARFYTTAVPFLAFLTARGASLLSERIGRRLTCWLLASFVGYGMFFYIPFRLIPAYACGYEEVVPGLDRSAAHLREPSLILIPQEDGNTFRYTSGFIHNDPWLTGCVVFARDLGGGGLDCLRNSFPERALYRFEPSPSWQSGRVVPVPP